MPEGERGKRGRRGRGGRRRDRPPPVAMFFGRRPCSMLLWLILQATLLTGIGSFTLSSCPRTSSQLLLPRHHSLSCHHKGFFICPLALDRKLRFSMGLRSKEADLEQERSTYLLAEITRNKAEIDQAIAREDYEEAARLRDLNKRMVGVDEFTRLQRDMAAALEEEDYRQASELLQELLQSLSSRSSNPVRLDRIACLTREGQINIVSPDGREHVALADPSDTKTRYTMPVWSPSGDMVASVAFTGTALNSKVDSRHTLTVFQSRNGDCCFSLALSFSPYCLQWSKSGTNICYLSRTHRKQSEIVSVDVFPRLREQQARGARTSGEGMRRSSERMRQRSLCEGELLFFSHHKFANRPPGDILIHSGIDRLVFLLGADPQLPEDPVVLSNNSGLFGTPQFHPHSDILLFAEESAPLSRTRDARERGAEQQEKSPGLISQSFPRPVARDSFGVVGQLNSAWQRMKSAGQQQLVVARRRGGRRVLARLQASSSSFSFSPDGRYLALLERGAGREKLSVLKFVCADDLDETRCEDEQLVNLMDDEQGGVQRTQVEEDEFGGEQELSPCQLQVALPDCASVRRQALPEDA
eukprot:519654-Hanusia_phi.AAC.1